MSKNNSMTDRVTMLEDKIQRYAREYEDDREGFDTDLYSLKYSINSVKTEAESIKSTLNRTVDNKTVGILDALGYIRDMLKTLGISTSSTGYKWLNQYIGDNS